jgi:hypothetical protein
VVPADRDGLSRRRLLAHASAGAAALTLGGAVDALRAVAQSLPPPALSPDDPAVRATMAAFADTIVPGPAGGADPHPGAIEAGVLEEMYDPYYGANVTFPEVHNDLLTATPRVLGRPVGFDLELPYPDRERVMIDRIESFPDGGENLLFVLYTGIATLVYIAYYGTAQSREGPRYIGFPPRSDGYWPDHSYRVRFKGMTKDGNPP